MGPPTPAEPLPTPTLEEAPLGRRGRGRAHSQIKGVRTDTRCHLVDGVGRSRTGIPVCGRTGLRVNTWGNPLQTVRTGYYTCTETRCTRFASGGWEGTSWSRPYPFTGVCMVGLYAPFVLPKPVGVSTRQTCVARTDSTGEGHPGSSRRTGGGGRSVGTTRSKRGDATTPSGTERRTRVWPSDFGGPCWGCGTYE